MQTKRKLTQQSKGKVVWFNAKKGYGFIKPTKGGRDIFVHHSGISGFGFKTLINNDNVEFDKVIDSTGKYRAINVTGEKGKEIKGT